jgi:hypothetical protein
MRGQTGTVRKMTTVSAPNRTVIAVLFLIGGALQVLGAIVGLLNAGNAGGFYLLSNLAIGVGFALMFAWIATSMIDRLAYLVAAIGWLLLALTALTSLGFLGPVAVFVAIVGTVWAGIMVMMTRPFRGEANILFLVAALAGAFNLLLSQDGSIPRPLVAIVVVAFGALLVAASLVILGKRLPRPTAGP